MELEKSEVPWDLARLIKDKVITMEDLSDFSVDMQEWVQYLLSMRN